MDMSSVDVAASSAKPMIGQSRGNIDFATLQMKTWNQTAAIGLSVKVAPVEFFFDGDKLPHFRCPPGTRRAGKWTDKLGTDCELGGARVALARIGERMQRVAHGKPGKNEDLPSIGERVEFRIVNLADRLNPRRDEKKPGRGVATALEGVADALDGGKGKRRPGRGVATILEDAADVVDGGKGKKRPKVRRRRIAEPLPSGKRVEVSKPERPKAPSAASRARTATEDAAAKISVDRSARRREILNALDGVANLDAEKRHMIDINRNAPKFLKERDGGGKWEDPAFLDRAVQRRERIRKALVKHRDEIDALLERDRKDNALTKEERQALHKRAANIELYLEKNDNHLDEIRARIRELENKPPTEPKRPVKKVPAKRVVKKAVPGKKAVKKKAVKKKAVKKATSPPSIIMLGSSTPTRSSAKPRLSTKKPTAEVAALTSANPMLGGNFESILKGITNRENARRWDEQAANNLERDQQALLDAVDGSTFSPSEIAKLANQHGKKAIERQALENRLGQLEREADLQDKLDFQDRAIERDKTARFQGLRALLEDKRKQAIDQRDRMLAQARDLEEAAWGSKKPERYNEHYPKIAPNESVKDFLRRLEVEKLARGWDQQAKDHEAGVLKVDQHLVERARAAQSEVASGPKNSQGNGVRTLNSFIDDMDQVAQANRARAIELQREADQHRRNGDSMAAQVAEDAALENDRMASHVEQEREKVIAERDRLLGVQSAPQRPAKKGVKKRPAKKAVKRTGTGGGNADGVPVTPPSGSLATEAQDAVRARAIDKKIKLRNKRPQPLGLAGKIDEQGRVRIQPVPAGHKGINTPDEARKFVENGGAIADVPDEFLREMFMGPTVQRGSQGPLVHPDLASLWAARRPGGAMGDNLLLVDPHDPDNPYGFMVKQGEHMHEAVNELQGIELAHEMGIPVVPGRYDGNQGNNGRNRVVVLEHGLNAIEGGRIYGHYDTTPMDVDREHVFGFEARIPHFLVNFFFDVHDRHTGNGLQMRDQDGNWVILPIDIARAGRVGAGGDLSLYAGAFWMDLTVGREGRVGRMIRTLPADQRSEATRRVRAAIEKSRNAAQAYVDRKDEIMADHRMRLEAVGASASEISNMMTQMEKNFGYIKTGLRKNSLDDMYKHFGVN